jgi:hypothetical protein
MCPKKAKMKYKIKYGFDGQVWVELDIDNGKQWQKVQIELHDHYTKLGMVFIQEGKAWLNRSEHDYFDKNNKLFNKSSDNDTKK